MSAPRFLVAKYIPDLRRMEPKNIGVVLWSDGDVRAKFVGELQAGRVDPPQYLHVNSRRAYRQWITYCRTVLDRSELPDKSGRPVHRSAPEFIEAITARSKDQFRLVEGGEFLKSVRPDEMGEVVDELFAELVSIPSENDSVTLERANAARQLTRACREAVTQSGLRQRRGFSEHFEWLCPVEDSKVPFQFDYAIYDRQPIAILSKVFIWKPEDVYAAAFEFREMRREYQLPKEKCAAMIYPTATDLSTTKILETWKMLEACAEVLDMRDARESTSRLMFLAA